MGACSPFHDLQIPALTLLQALVSQLLAPIGGVRPNLLEPRHEVRETTQQLAGTDRVMDIGERDVPGDGQAQGVDQQVSLAALDELAAVIAADAPRFLDRLDALAVHDGRARIGMSSDALALGAVQGRIERVQGVLAAELPEMVVHRLPGREIRGELAPRAAGAQHVEDGVEDTAKRVHALRGLPRRESGGR
jgi:hypothetical protein